MSADNVMKVELQSLSQNEGVARVVVASFAALLDPTVDEMEDIKTAVSEAVTNCVVHAYEGGDGVITLQCSICGDVLTVAVEDAGRGIADVKKAREPMYSTAGDLERSGMGFTVMENFMDSLEVESAPGKGTRVVMTKRIAHEQE